MDADVDQVIGTYLELVDEYATGLIEVLYLEGSLALDDFQPSSSDIDFIAVTAEKPDEAALTALSNVHGELGSLHRRPFFDGIYFAWSELAEGPTAVVNAPASHAGQFHPNSPPGRANPVTWHTVAKHAVTCRGPLPTEINVWAEPAALAAWQNNNLDEYWLRCLIRARRLPSKPGIGLLTDYGTVWTVTGIARLHYTIATGDITSKHGAGQHALSAFPTRWHRLVDEAVRIRRSQSSQSFYGNRFARRRDILAFGHMAVADAHRLYDERPR